MNLDDYLTPAQRRAAEWMHPPRTGPQWGDWDDDDEPCMCGTRFTCHADEHPPCDNCGGDPATCDCDES